MISIISFPKIETAGVSNKTTTSSRAPAISWLHISVTYNHRHKHAARAARRYLCYEYTWNAPDGQGAPLPSIQGERWQSSITRDRADIDGCMASVLNFVFASATYFKAPLAVQRAHPRPACEMGWCMYGKWRFASSRSGLRPTSAQIAYT
jgi:hypothetical protein